MRIHADPIAGVELEIFVRESNRIEGILRDPTDAEVRATGWFLERAQVALGDLDTLVSTLQPCSTLRRFPGMDVRVGNHLPPPGGQSVVNELCSILDHANGNTAHPYRVHCWYETLHPFMDGNGRSGRALWAWQMLKFKYHPGIQLGFLHEWYYQSLQEPRGDLASNQSQGHAVLDGHL